MDMKRKLGALALVAAVAGAGWALQLPQGTTAPAADPAAPRAAAPEAAQAKASAHGLSVLAWPQPALETDEDAAAHGSARDSEDSDDREDSEDIEGLEQMSATGAASPRQEP